MRRRQYRVHLPRPRPRRRPPRFAHSRVDVPPAPAATPDNLFLVRLPRSNAAELSCPRCGATLNAPTEVRESGWAQLPGRKDMAKLQFGNSFCQIEGVYVPVADMKLAPADSIYFTHHVLLWKDPQVNITTMPLRGGWKRMFAGMPLIMTQAQGPGHIAFSRDAPGELIALPLQPGEAIDVREHLFLLATGNVGYDWFATNIWFTTQSATTRKRIIPWACSWTASLPRNRPACSCCTPRAMCSCANSAPAKRCW